MKRSFKLFALILGCIVAGTTTSCLNNDSNPEQEHKTNISNAISSLTGNYNGTMEFTANNSLSTAPGITLRLDTAGILMDNFPVSQLVGTIQSDYNLRTAIAKAPATSIKMGVALYQLTEKYHFQVAPSKTTLTLDYGGEKHQVEITFNVADLSTSYGIFDPAFKQLTFLMQIESISVDGKASAIYPTLIKYTSGN